MTDPVKLPPFSGFTEVFKIDLFYDISSFEMGESFFGTLNKATCKSSGSLRAVNIIDKFVTMNDEVYNRIKFESRILSEADHPCILKVHELLEDQEYFYIVQELHSGK